MRVFSGILAEYRNMYGNDDSHLLGSLKHISKYLRNGQNESHGISSPPLYHSY